MYIQRVILNQCVDSAVCIVQQSQYTQTHTAVCLNLKNGKAMIIIIIRYIGWIRFTAIISELDSMNFDGRELNRHQ